MSSRVTTATAALWAAVSMGSGCVTEPPPEGAATEVFMLARSLAADHTDLLEHVGERWTVGDRGFSLRAGLATDAPARASDAWCVSGRSGHCELRFRIEAEATEGAVAGGALVYGAERDTSIIAAGRGNQLELFYLVRSANEPLRWRWHLDGARVRSTSTGEVDIETLEGTRFRMSAPWATDADGGSVAVAMAAYDDETVEITAEAPTRFPLLVDPIIEIVEWRDLSVGVLPARRDHTAVFDQARDVLMVFGGADASTTLADGWAWDGTSWRALVFGAMAPTARSSHSMVYVESSHTAVLFGGRSSGSSDLRDTWTWDGSTWMRLTPSTSPPARREHAMAYDPVRDRVVLFSGAAGAFMPPLTDTWEWDGSTWTDVSPSRSPPGREGHAMTFDPVSGHVVLFGGRGDSGLLSDVWEWDGSTWTARATTGAVAVSGHAIAFDPARSALITTGGTAATGAVAETRRLEGSTWLLEPGGDLPTARSGHAATVDRARNLVIVTGGYDAGPRRYYRGTIFRSGSAWVPQTLDSVPTARGELTATYDPARGVTVFGGRTDTSTVTNELWVFGGVNWTLVSSASPPPARSMHASWYDPVARLTYVHGGATGTATSTLGDMWSWDGSTWTAFTGTVPSRRSGHAAVYDLARGRAVLFGGTDDATWLWDGSSWTSVSPTPRPSARQGHAMVYDARRNVVVLFGGRSGGLAPLSDTWEWDGTAWRDTMATGPSRREGARMLFDSLRGTVILFGGRSTSTYPNDCWEWDGTAWYTITTRGMPSGRAAPAFAYQPDRNTSVMFGGSINGGLGGVVPAGDTWELHAYRALGSDCTRNEECGSGLCEAGRCVSADAGGVSSDAGGLDAPVVDAASSGDAAMLDAAVVMTDAPMVEDTGRVLEDAGSDTGGVLDAASEIAEDASFDAAGSPETDAAGSVADAAAVARDVGAAGTDAPLSEPDAGPTPTTAGCGCGALPSRGSGWTAFVLVTVAALRAGRRGARGPSRRGAQRIL